MKALFSTIIATVLFFNFSIAQSDNTSGHSIALNVPTVALVEVVNDASVSLSLTAPENAGEWFDQVTDNSSYLNVSSVVVKNGTRSINVKSTEIPAGLILKVSAEKVSSRGNLGSVNSDPIVLSTSDVGIITGIKTGYTEVGTGYGFRLTYSLDADLSTDATIESLESVNTAVTVTYTITE